MDNFKRNTPRRQQKPSSIDGFVRGSKSDSNKSFDRNRTLRPRQAQVGNFSRKDGFYGLQSQQQPPRRSVHRNQSSANENIQLEMPQANKPKRGPRKGKAHIIRKSLSTFMILFLLGGGYMFGKGYLSILSVFRGGGSAAALNENVDPAQLRGEGDGRVNILLLGRGGDGHEGADLTDTIIVASVDPVNKKAALLSIPRDLYVQPEGYGAMKINSVYAAGKSMADQNQDAEAEGMNLLQQTLEDTIGIPVHYNVTVDFEGFKQAVDAVGGVSIDVPEELAVYDNMHYGGGPYTLDVDEGEQQFDGLRALMFSRTRKTSPRGDFDRSARQRLTMVALKDKVVSIGTFSNPVKVNELLSALGNHVSSNLSTNEVMRIYQIASEIPNSDIASVGLADEPNSLVTTANYGGLSVVVPKAGNLNFEDIKSYVRNALRDGFLTNEDATVAVYNGTMVTGLAGRTADELESFGYNVSEVADAPSKGFVDTVLVDLTNGEKKYTKSYLEKRFGVTAVNSIPDNAIVPGEAEFVIILGTNEESRLEN